MDAQTFQEVFARPATASRYTQADIEARVGHKVVAYSWIPEARIPAAHVRFVRRHLDRVVREAGLAPVRLHWFGPAVGTPDFYLYAFADKQRIGMAGDAGIALLATARGPEVVRTIAHEVAHLTQAPELSHHEREARAERIGREYEQGQAR